MRFPEHYGFDLVLQTARQIERDLSLEEDSLALSGNIQTAFPELVLQLTPVIAGFERTEGHLQSVLYRVDISERSYRSILSTSASGERIGQITEAIIRREFQKVLTRKYFSAKNPG
jgi:hypothetical protein